VTRRGGELACILLGAALLALACAGWLAPDGCGPGTAILSPSDCH
jgi:hypothetical protein